MSKRDIILDAMQKLMTDNEAKNATISDVAKKAGIGKGSIYYYFSSKDEIIDAVLERAYSKVIDDSNRIADSPELNALEKMCAIFNLSVFPSDGNRQWQLLKMLNLQDDVVVHQKFCVIAVREITPILSRIIVQGQEEGVLSCPSPRHYAQFILSMLLMSLDSVLIPADREETLEKLKSLSHMLEDSMHMREGSLGYFYRPPKDPGSSPLFS